jgi:DNA-binding MarR family transcriptional regulator
MTVRASKDTDPQAVTPFSPIFDEISRELGRSAASVYGVVWRHCQMRDGVCRASLRRLAGLLGCSQSTVKRQLRLLVEKGFLEDITPGYRNRPHYYCVSTKGDNES